MAVEKVTVRLAKTPEDMQAVAGFVGTMYRNPRKVHAYYMATVGNVPVGCAGIKKLAWHTTEVCHVFVAEKTRGQGVGKAMLKKLLAKVETPMVCATVKACNTASIALFTGKGFARANTFNNPSTGNAVHLFTRCK
jgi:N-acetylglutamate synthase-like GNAT family acetyltransferase